ncbi:stage III sporulation protein AA [Paenibacillus lemnae]|uniref:Stage III sporulation protein AA n=1 Tax=Paenibacillus lemnae TaxID=1330551 RepID=A0A848M9X3_PAELE|nr:stage III sporulation protein AA [Paenibacillus lemnae]NMO96872.1 stage III sporulation protein AA [Paenibacillus lemnae]
MNKRLLELFPDHLKSLLLRVPGPILERLEEIRIREGRPLEINYGGQFQFLKPCGGFTCVPDDAYKPAREDTLRLLDMISNHSLYTLEEELRKGFITIAGGHRVGLTGRTVLSGGKVEHLRDISGFNLRIAREVRGAADKLLPFLMDYKRKRVLHTLILSPPQHGKTTMLRDLARLISQGEPGSSSQSCRGLKVGIIDERSEIAGCIQGVPSFEVGPRTDILDGCPKAEGMMMMIRSMSPDVLIVDEIGRSEDAEAVYEALHAGISVIATAHGASLQDIKERQGLDMLIEKRMFERYAVLSRSSEGSLFRLHDGSHRTLQTSMAGGAVT